MKKKYLFLLLFTLYFFCGHAQSYFHEQVLSESDNPLQVESGFYDTVLINQFLTKNEVQNFLNCIDSLGIHNNATYNILEIPNDTILSLLYDTLIFYSQKVDSLINNAQDYLIFQVEDSFPNNPILYVFNAYLNFSSLRSKIEAELLTLEHRSGVNLLYNPDYHHIVSDYMRSFLNTNNAIVIDNNIYLYGEEQQIVIPNKNFNNLSSVLSFWYNFGEFHGTFKAFKENIARPIIESKSVEDLDNDENPCDYMRLIVDMVDDHCPRTFYFDVLSHLGSIESIYWDFGDQTTSSDLTPTHEYESSGLYNIEAIISLRNGDVLQCSYSIRVSDCIVFFSQPVSTTTDDGLLCEFGLYPHHCDEDAEIVSYNWSFGNGETSQEAEPTVLFENDGRFNVNVTIQYSDGCVATNSMIMPVSGTGNCCKNFSKDTMTVISLDNEYKITHTFSTYNIWPFHRIVVKTIHYKKKLSGNWKREKASFIENSFGGVITHSTNRLCDNFEHIYPNGLTVYNKKVNNYDYGVGERFRIRKNDLYSIYNVKSNDMTEARGSDDALYLHNRNCQ